MSSPLTAKRRKLNETSKTLAKPFVSPLKRSGSASKPLQENNNAANVSYQPSTLAHTITAAPCSAPTRKGTPFTPVRSTPIRKQQSFNTSTKRTADPAEVAAQRALTSLELQIRAIKNELDTLKQASCITNSTTDADLEETATKWKLASQSAAEELFGTVKERVCRMGGVQAWRETEKRKYERANGMGEFAQEHEAPEDDDKDCEFDSQGEELEAEEMEYRKKLKAKARAEMRDAMEDQSGEQEAADAGGSAGKKAVWQEEGKDDDTFTIDMMLRSLNIELNVIGYDKVAQRWTA
ncbi:hypothetical protein LTR37_013451 [Vermiconidia calcicola]|uniref:Uncharacterized protein n=1 Tax=Vermiconidia calcicola TaxID=1690605 RepID=A0ACC3MZ81_9PEZI|nr:hypothetical protein LTR37_013451 [Vermiconidia calcicola]